MKRCPQCNLTYDDVDLKFCLDDGAELVLRQSEAPVTAVMSESENNVSETIEVPAADRPPPPAADVPPTVAAHGSATSNLVPVIIGVAVLLLLGLFILIAASFFPWRDNVVGFFLVRLARRLPMVLLALGGIAFAGFRWKRHPRASLITAIALVIFLVDLVIYTALLYWLPGVIDPMRLSVSASRWLYSVVYFVDDVVTAAIIILLVAAAFTDRKASIASSKHNA